MKDQVNKTSPRAFTWCGYGIFPGNIKIGDIRRPEPPELPLVDRRPESLTRIPGIC